MTKIHVSEAAFACYSKVCAPPPAGRGGSSKGSGKLKVPSKYFGLWGAKHSKVAVTQPLNPKRSRQREQDIDDFLEAGGKLSWKSGPAERAASNAVNRARLKKMVAEGRVIN